MSDSEDESVRKEPDELTSCSGFSGQPNKRGSPPKQVKRKKKRNRRPSPSHNEESLEETMKEAHKRPKTTKLKTGTGKTKQPKNTKSHHARFEPHQNKKQKQRQEGKCSDTTIPLF